jgi:hypothetical protein
MDSEKPPYPMSDGLDSFDSAIQGIKRDFRISLVLKHEELITRLVNAFENMVSNPKSICEEIKNSLKEEIADKIVSARLIEHHCPDKWKNENEWMSDLSTADIVNCKACDKPMKSHFYQFYNNPQTNEHYITGLITSIDEADRYNLLAEYKKRKDGADRPYAGQFEHLPCKKEILCPECYKESEANINAIDLRLVPDSFNAELASYMATLPDLSHYPKPRLFDEECCFGLLNELKHNLTIAFTEKDDTYECGYEEDIDDLRNNFIKDKARRYPNDDELTRWMRKRMGDEIFKCKIFDMWGLGYSEWARRFVVIVQLINEGGPWCSLPVEQFVQWY